MCFSYIKLSRGAQYNYPIGAEGQAEHVSGFKAFLEVNADTELKDSGIGPHDRLRFSGIIRSYGQIMFQLYLVIGNIVPV
jgi:hypothetical protein